MTLDPAHIGLEEILTMKLTQEQEQQMQSIIAEMQNTGLECKKNYQCYQSGLEDLCNVRGIGAFDEVKCNSAANPCCGLSESYLGESFCICPLRRYIAQTFHR